MPPSQVHRAARIPIDGDTDFGIAGLEEHHPMSHPGVNLENEMDTTVWTAIGLLAATSLGTLFYLGHRIDGQAARIDALAARMDARFDAVDARFDALIGRLDTRFDRIDARFDHMVERFDAIGARLDPHRDPNATG